MRGESCYLQPHVECHIKDVFFMSRPPKKWRRRRRRRHFRAPGLRRLPRLVQGSRPEGIMTWACEELLFSCVSGLSRLTSGRRTKRSSSGMLLRASVGVPPG
ncbi:hypothetical protein BRADI_3g58946v3 [Brachypodium distachyon]|uniref:Uncharacterized protein n=1 Tax=Brachypodium distachyon TaxID=15368 RepID=A0A2K2D5Q7_BRADI|nr:hypothetical protein BRADI_3g58946v3 [Brachypodium distachyon]